MQEKINMVAILVAVVVNFVWGFLWYTPIFGKAWGKEMGYDPNEKPDKSVLIKGMLFMVIGNFFFAWVLAHNMAAWSYVPDMDEMSKGGILFSTALFTWLGFYFPGELGATVWSKNSWKLFAINSGYHLSSLFIVAAILLFWP
ncbi:MAG: DUF1761 domain-containing protein [Flavobacteriales bacterium]|nr:DUF1761 domain-containing protein [Flavobacteriales bacterium]